MPAFLIGLGISLLKAVARHVVQAQEEKIEGAVKGMVHGLYEHVNTHPEWQHVEPQDLSHIGMPPGRR